MTSTQPIRTARGSVAVVNAHVVPVASAPVERGTVLVEDGVITAVGADVVVPAGVRTLDVAGRWVLPGFVEAHGHVGVDEEAEGWAGNDANEMTDPNGAALRAVDAINPEDTGFRDALAGGVTSVVVKPGSGNPIGGQTVAVKTWGGRTVEVSRTLYVERSAADGDGGWFVYFSDGRPFHPWSVETPVEHPCGRDVYAGRISGDRERWTVEWRASGPEKDYVMTTVHTDRRDARPRSG